jgi:hypothetical protein
LRLGPVLVLAALAGASCGDSTTPNAPDAASDAPSGGDALALDPAAACNAYYAAGIAREVACYGIPTDVGEPFLVMAPPDLELYCAGIGDLVQQGHILYDASKLEACLTAIAALSCQHTFDWYVTPPAACFALRGGTFQAQLATGSTCHTAAECTGGICDVTSNGCPGKCAEFPPELGPGQACGPTDSCTSGYYCGSSGKCVADVAQGGSCAGGEQCADGLYCDNTTATCLAQKTSGQCLQFDQCLPPEHCFGLSPSGTPGRCENYRKVGESCVATECTFATYCDPMSSTCKESPKLGQTCGKMGQDVAMCIDSWCSAPVDSSGNFTSTGTCQARLVAGTACNPDRALDPYQCAPGAACTGTAMCTATTCF